MLSGLGFGLFQVSNNRNMFLAAPRERSGAAGGMLGTAGLARQAGALPLDLAPCMGLGVAAALTFVAGLVSMSRA